MAFDPMIASALIGAGSSALGGIYGMINGDSIRADQRKLFYAAMLNQDFWNYQNLGFAEKVNDQQLEIDNRNYDYMVAENQLQKQREDTAHQREVADLRAAGLSPLASLQGSTTGSTVSQAMGINPTVPQADGTGYANLFSTAMNNQSAMSGIRQQLANEFIKAGSSLAEVAVKHKGEKLIRDENARDAMSRLQAELSNNKELQDSKFGHEIDMWIRRQDEILTVFNNDMALLREEIDHKQAEKILTSYETATGGRAEYSNESDSYIATWNGALHSRVAKELAEIDEYLIKRAKGTYTSESKGFNAGVDAHFPLSLQDVIVPGSGFLPQDRTVPGGQSAAGGGARYGSTSGSASGSSDSFDGTAYARERMKVFWSKPENVFLIPYGRK